MNFWRRRQEKKFPATVFLILFVRQIESNSKQISKSKSEKKEILFLSLTLSLPLTQTPTRMYTRLLFLTRMPTLSCLRLTLTDLPADCFLGSAKSKLQCEWNILKLIHHPQQLKYVPQKWTNVKEFKTYNFRWAECIKALGLSLASILKNLP